LPLAEAEGSARRKLAFDLPLDVDTLERIIALPLPDESRRALAVLQRATADRIAVACRYYSIGRNVAAERVLEPYGLLFQWSQWYCVARARDRDAIRVFRLDRISEARPLEGPDARFEVPDSFDIRRYAGRAPWELGEGPPTAVRVRFEFPESHWVMNRRTGVLAVSHPDGNLDAWGEGKEMSALTITVYGGAAGPDESTGEIGGNKILLEFDDRAWLLDFGTRFGESGKYFDEFLQPRAAVGLRDFLRMGLIPPLEGLYRDDLSLHEPGLWERYRGHPQHRRLDHLDGVLLSHAHQDHNGCLGFLRCEIPIYTGLMTALIGKGMQDIAGGGPEAQYCYVAPKKLSDDGVLESIRATRLGRPHYICESDDVITTALENLRSFFGYHPGKKTTFHPAALEVADLDPLGLRFFRVDHSIPGSGAFAIRTPIGWVGYTGDLRLHGHSRKRTEKFARELAELRPALLIVEGTSLRDGESTTEAEVQQAAHGVVRVEPGLVIADFSPRNIERLRTFRDIAKDLGRRLVVTLKDAYLLEQMNVIDSAIPRPDEEGMAILTTPRASRESWMDRVMEEFPASLVDAKTIRARQSDYILCLSYWDITNLIDIEPEAGTYIYSSSEAYDEEQAFDHQRLVNWLELFHMKRVGGLPGSEKGPFHASGHIDGKGMEWLIETIQPGKLLPVHTQKLGWFEQRWPGQVVRAAFGEPVRFD
jgi:ribonuclease J